VRRPRLAAAAVLIGIAAVLAAGYAAAGPAGLIAVASVATIGVLIVARGMVRGQKPPPVLAEKRRREPGRWPALRSADFPAYRRIASDLEWARMSQRHYERILRPMLARLAEALGRPRAADLARPGRPADVDGPGVDLPALERIVAMLEDR
jgi:hypothetical protein